MRTSDYNAEQGFKNDNTNLTKQNRGERQMDMNQQQQNFNQQQQMNMGTSDPSTWKGIMARGAVVGNRKNIKIIESMEYPQYGLRVEVMEYQELLGSTNVYSAQALWFMKETNIKCRQIALYIMNSGVKIEAGAMSYFQGPLQMNTGIDGVGKLASQIFTGKLTGERIIMPEYKGTGLLVLEPSFKHFIPLELEAGEAIVCDKGMFYAASSSVSIQPCFAGGVSGSVLGGEGIFQQMISGPGMVLLESPVPECEINRVHLENDVLRVDGNFALFRTASLGMTVERAGQTFIGSAASGEGLVNVFRGTGDVWIAPTIKVYDAIALAKSMGGNLTAVDMNTSTGRAKTK